MMCTSGFQAKAKHQSSSGLLRVSILPETEPSSPKELFQWEEANQQGTQQSLYEQAVWDSSRNKHLFSLYLGHVSNFISYSTDLLTFDTALTNYN